MSSEEETPEAEEESVRVEDDASFDDRRIPDVLPVLPLRNTVLFPTRVTRTPMIATTTRARCLIDAALESDRLLVVVAARDAEVEEPREGDLNEVGTVVRIDKATRGEDGSQRLWVQGLRRARIGDYVQKDPFLKAKLESV